MLDPIEIILRTVAVMAAGLLAILLLSTCREQRAALPGAFLCLAVAAFFATSFSGAGQVLGGFGYLLTALCVTKAVWYWLFARALFSDKAALGEGHLGIVAVVAVAGTWQQKAFLPVFREGAASAPEMVAGFGVDAVLLVFVLMGLHEAWRDMATDLVERRRRLRFGFIAATGIYLTATLGVQSYNLLLGVSTPPAARLANMVVAAAACLAGAGLLLRFRTESWLDMGRSAPKVALSRAESAVMARLELALDEDRVFLEEGLTIGALARRLGTGEHVLRRVINRGMGYRNFNDFLNAWRIREACE